MDKKKILIAEDEDNMRVMLGLELKTAGYEVCLAEDGEKALELAREFSPDLVISDILMPKMDGNQFMQKLRQSGFGAHIPFIVLTARGQMHDYFEMMDVDDFIIKPFDAEDLLMRVKKVLHKTDTAALQTKRVELSAGMKKKVLVIDDDRFFCSKLEKPLTDSGYEVYTVHTISECVEQAINFKPDAIALKSLVDGLGADKLINIMKGISQIKNAPVIVYTPQAVEMGYESLLQAGAAAFIGGANPEKIRNSIKKHIPSG